MTRLPKTIGADGRSAAVVSPDLCSDEERSTAFRVRFLGVGADVSCVSLSDRARNEAASDWMPVKTVGPYHGLSGKLRLREHCAIWDVDPFPIDVDAIVVAVLELVLHSTSYGMAPSW